MTDTIYDPYAEDNSPATPPRSGFFTPFGVVVTLAALLMIAVVAWGIYQNSLTQPQEGQAPDFDLPLIGNSEASFKLSEQRGQVVVINFWGSWCGPCREEAPMLQNLYEEYQAQGVVFVGIAVKDIERDSLAYIDEFNITYPNVMDVGANIEKAYRTEGVPETFIVDKNGEIVKFFYAQPPEAELREVIEAAIQS